MYYISWCFNSVADCLICFSDLLHSGQAPHLCVQGPAAMMSALIMSKVPPSGLANAAKHNKTPLHRHEQLPKCSENLNVVLFGSVSPWSQVRNRLLKHWSSSRISGSDLGRRSATACACRAQIRRPLEGERTPISPRAARPLVSDATASREHPPLSWAVPFSGFHPPSLWSR